MPEQRPFLERLVFGKQHGPRVEHGEKILQYPLHRMKADAKHRGVLQEPYMRRNFSRGEIDEIIMNPELVHDYWEHLEHVFASGELDPRRRR
jgi:hypothetical protein